MKCLHWIGLISRSNKQDAKTLGEFLTHAVHHIREGGNIAICETKLADGKAVKLTLERI